MPKEKSVRSGHGSTDPCTAVRYKRCSTLPLPKLKPYLTVHTIDNRMHIHSAMLGRMLAAHEQNKNCLHRRVHVTESSSVPVTHSMHGYLHMHTCTWTLAHGYLHSKRRPHV